MSDYLTTAQVCKRLKCSPATVSALIKAGKITGVKRLRAHGAGIHLIPATALEGITLQHRKGVRPRPERGSVTTRRPDPDATLLPGLMARILETLDRVDAHLTREDS